MPRLSLGLGVQSVRKIGGGGAAPSGIVAATAGELIIDFGYFSGEFYTKNNNTLWLYNFGEGSEFQRLSWNIFSANAWALDTNNGEIVATNPSSNSLIIPTTGWTYTVGDGPAVTITAA
jgi:hypothetical protein